jgi:hypothetical protein
MYRQKHDRSIKSVFYGEATMIEYQLEKIDSFVQPDVLLSVQWEWKGY